MPNLQRLAGFLGHLARPWCLYVAGGAAGWTTVTIPYRPDVSLIEGAAYITAAWAGVAAIYLGKAYEERGKTKSQADVEIARATGLDGAVKPE